ncbi:hypothetical protein LXL04_035098 [Taraxacum kok-saghyz]
MPRGDMANIIEETRKELMEEDADLNKGKTSGKDIAVLLRLLVEPGKHPDYGGGTRKREDCELNWSKGSMFFKLTYWSSLPLKHNLDVIPIDRNMCDSLLGTLLMNSNSKDTSNTRVDLENLNIQKTPWLRQRDNKCYKPQPRYLFTDDPRKLFC